MTSILKPFDDCSLDDIYHALDVIAENKDDLQTWIYEKFQKICQRDMSVSSSTTPTTISISAGLMWMKLMMKEIR